MSTFTTFIQHSIGSSSHSDQKSKNNKKHPNGKKEVKLSLFADNIIVYIENPICSTKTKQTNKNNKNPKKLLNLISEFGKIEGYKVNIQKLKSFCTPTHKYQSQKLGKKFIH